MSHISLYCIVCSFVSLLYANDKYSKKYDYCYYCYCWYYCHYLYYYHFYHSLYTLYILFELNILFILIKLHYNWLHPSLLCTKYKLCILIRILIPILCSILELFEFWIYCNNINDKNKQINISLTNKQSNERTSKANKNMCLSLHKNKNKRKKMKTQQYHKRKTKGITQQANTNKNNCYNISYTR